MEIDWRLEVSDIADEIISNRQYFHSHPELGNKEFLTAEYIEKKLSEYGIKTQRLLDTAVIGYLDGAKTKKTAALRADMDALPIREMTGCAYSSENGGIMHACGHDVHISAALGAARLLSAHRNELSGNVRFIFQPDEEGDGGAERLVEAGVMQDVDAVFGAHVSPDLAFGRVGFKKGKFYAASDIYKIRVTGKSAHGAEPEKGIDALYAAALIMTRLHELPKELAPEKAVVTTGKLSAGTAVNIVPGEALIEGIIRTLGSDSRAYIKQRAKDIADSVSRETGAKAELLFKESYPGVVNTDSITEFAQKSVSGLIGSENAVSLTEPTMTTEDFGYYIDAAKGCFYHIGVGGGHALHNPMFLPPENAPVMGAMIHAKVIFDYLSNILCGNTA